MARKTDGRRAATARAKARRAGARWFFGRQGVARRVGPGWVALAVAVAAVLAAAAAAAGQEAGEARLMVQPPAPLAAGSAPAAEPGSQPVPAPPGPVLPLADVEWAGLVWSSGGDGVVPAVQLGAEVEISIAGLVARSRVRQRFVNPGEEWVEGVYVFPLPENGAIDRLRMRIGDRVIEGQVREKEAARQAFEEARREGRRASLLEQHRPNVFTSRVANVGPGETVEVTIELQQPVDFDAGRLRLRFPTVVTPRYFPGAPAPGEGDGGREVPEMLLGADPRAAGEGRPRPVPAVERREGAAAAPPVPALVAAAAGRAGRALERIVEELRPEPGPPNRLVLAVHLDAGFPLATLSSPSHAIDVAAAGERGWRVALAAQGGAADRDFELVWEPAPGRVPRTALFTEEHDGDTYALLVVLPPEAEADGWAPLAREVVFVLDTSGSMAGEAMEQARAALGAALARLEPWDLFNVIEFDDRARPLFAASVPADAAAVERARRWVAGLEADGGTDMRQALALALAGSEPGYRRGGGERVRQIVFLTDGAVGNEAELFGMISAGLGDARLFTVGIGAAPNGWFMRRAAEVGRGSFTWIGDLATVGSAIDELARKLEGPVLTDLEVSWDDPTAETWPERLPDLYAGEPLVVAARLIRRGEEVRVSGRRGGVWWEETVRVEAAEAAAPVAAPAAGRGVRQLWARRKIDHWMGRLTEGVPEDEVRREVVAVALAHHLVSQYTSLVAVDVTPVRPHGAALAAAAVPLALPAGHLPMGGTAARRDVAIGLVLMLASVPLLVGRRKGRHAADGAGGGEG